MLNNNRTENFIAVIKAEISELLILAGFVVMFFPTFSKLVEYGWRNADYDHGIFILPISLYLIWQRRDQLSIREDVDVIGTLLLMLGAAAYLVGTLSEFMFLEAGSFVLMAWAVAWLRLTKESLRVISFPLLYLLFLIPPPGFLVDMITFPLKEWSTYGSYLMLKSFHLPVTVQGAILNVNGQELFVTDACSGFRSLTTLLALGAVYAYLQGMGRVRSWILFLSVIPFSIMGNIVRISLTGGMVLLFGLETAEGFFHEFSGIVVYIFTVLTLMVFNAFLRGWTGGD